MYPAAEARYRKMPLPDVAIRKAKPVAKPYKLTDGTCC
jgi:hypothetical protein